jgi:hypothetical protein
MYLFAELTIIMIIHLSRLHRNSTGGTGTHSAGKLTKTKVSGEEDS